MFVHLKVWDNLWNCMNDFKNYLLENAGDHFGCNLGQILFRYSITYTDARKNSFLTIFKNVENCLWIRFVYPSIRALTCVNIVRITLRIIMKLIYVIEIKWYVRYLKLSTCYSRFVYRDIQKNSVILLPITKKCFAERFKYIILSQTY